MPSSFPSPPNWKYDVFPSFRGEDVRRSFLSHIRKAFESNRINLFVDEEIQRGVTIGSSIIEGIRGSRIAIVMLSRNYASSSWCLNELVEIMKCREELGQAVVTVFYDVDRTDVKKQSGDFGKIFKKTCKGKPKDYIRRWRRALKEVSTIAGYHSRNWDNEAVMIESIATDISNMLNNSTLDFDGLVGMTSHMEKMELLLRLDLDEARMIGIWGPPGIGKTAIARFLFSKLSSNFQLSAFMGNIKELYPRRCLDEYSAKLRLQEHFMSRIFNQKDIIIPHLGVIQERLKDKKVFAVLDDVDSLEQLEALAKVTQWFGPGSRIIITTQDIKLLKALGINYIYEVGLPPPDEALQIFCMHAFGQRPPYDGFEKLAGIVTTLCGESPLGLRFMGSYFRGKSKKEWENELPRLRTSLHGEIRSIIKFTYDSLCDDDKERYHRLISDVHDGEITKRMELYLAKKGVSEVREERIITNLDLKEDTYTSERAFEVISNTLPHTADIFCEDTLQDSFASHLSMDFRRKGIAAFVNFNGTLDVIEGASASVLVFSKSCFSSTSCMDKLVRVLQCQRKTGQLVVPVFYGISLSDVVVQEYESADQITEWSSVIQELRELPGHQSREGCSECEFVEEIVKDVCEKLYPTEQIGINSRLLEIEQLLCNQPWRFRRIGIWGMPGIGKTTLAKAFFDQISGRYEASCFIKHFDKAFHEKGLYPLLEEHFGKVLKELPGVCSSITRPRLPGDKLNKKRTLVVLDDVHNPLIAESFLGGFHWFGPGSLIIITSRDKQVFSLCQINHVYEVQSLNEKEALQLFSHCAFGKDIRERSLLELSMEVIDYANGNPFALRFYGRELKQKELSEVRTTFLKFKQHIPHEIHDLFKSSYETLNDNQKNIFLDIACFFKGENVDYVMQLLEGYCFLPHVGVDVLVEKCLVTISENRVNMHNLIQDFGREIINREIVKTKRRLPKGLQLLHWENYPLQSLPQDFDSGHLVELNMSYSQLQKLWGGTKKLDMLKRVRLCHSPQLIEIGDLCKAQNIELIDLEGCKKLHSFPDIAHLHHLRVVNLSGCREIKSFPEVSPNIVELDLQGTGIRALPISIGNAANLEKLNLGYCSSLAKLPSCIGNATNLKELYLTGCSSLVELPTSIGNATNLKILDLSKCSSLKKLPSSIGNATNLQKLNLRYCSSLVELPSSIGNATNLQKLNLEYCSSLVELPSSFEHAKNLKELCLTGCLSLSSIRNSTSLISTDTIEDNNLPIVTFSNNSESRWIEVRRANRGNVFVLTGKQNDEHFVSFSFCIEDKNGSQRNIYFLFNQEGDTSSKVSNEMVEQLDLPDVNATFIAELIDILLVNIIPTWKPDVTIDHLIHSELNQFEAKSQREEETAFPIHDAIELVSLLTSDEQRPDKEDKKYVDATKLEDGSIKQDTEEVNEPVSLEEEEERLRQELEELEAKYHEEMKEITRKREAIQAAKRKFSLK